MNWSLCLTAFSSFSSNIRDKHIGTEGRLHTLLAEHSFILLKIEPAFALEHIWDFLINTNIRLLDPQTMDLWHSANHSTLASLLKKLMLSLDISFNCSLEINRYARITNRYVF